MGEAAETRTCGVIVGPPRRPQRTSGSLFKRAQPPSKPTRAGGASHSPRSWPWDSLPRPVVSQHLEEALTGRFGVEWVARDDGHGFEIKGISGAMMRVFSSRRESITADLRTHAARFEQRYGRKRTGSSP